MRIGSLVLLGMLATSPGPAAALEDLRLACVFDLECVDTEPCEMAAYGMDFLITGDEEPWAVMADTDAETLSGEAYELGDSLWMRLSSSIGPVMITVDIEGFARQSIHTTGELSMINYTGGCGVLE